MELTPPLLQLATQALDRVLDFKRPADSELSAFFRDHKKLGPRERAFVAEAVFGVLRRYRYLSVVVPAANPRTLIIAWLIKSRGMSGATLEQFAKPELVQHIRDAKTDDLPLAVAAELPEWVIEKLQPVMSDADILVLGRALQLPAPMDVRVNAYKADRDTVLAQLREEGLAVEPTPYSPWGIRFKDHPAINRHPLFLDGSLEVQDDGSQLLALLLGARRGEMVCDFCAGAGGKTLAIGAMMASSGRLYAFDVAEKRLAKLKPRLARSGLSNVMPQLIASENDTRVKRLAGKLDRVLVDAPCSGLGHLAPQPGPEIPPVAGERGGADAETGVHPARGRETAEARRPAGVCHLQPAAGRERSHRRSAAGRRRVHPAAGERIAGAEQDRSRYRHHAQVVARHARNGRLLRRRPGQGSTGTA